MNEISGLFKLYLQPNLRNTFDGHPLRSCWPRWIDRKERKKESSCTYLSGGL